MTFDSALSRFDSALSRFVTQQPKAILFVVALLCLGGAYAASTMPSSVFPQTNFPRVVILVDNGVMPADQMMATITRPIEEAMKDIPGAVNIRSATGRGSAEVNVFFTWNVNMIESELYVLGRLAQIRSTLPSTATTSTFRITFSAFPILGISLTSATRNIGELWEVARYDLKPRFLRIPGVSRVDLVGGRVPEYHVIADPAKLESYRLTLTDVSDALAKTNLVSPAGMHEENRQLYLTVVDGRVQTPKEIEELVVGWASTSPIRVKDFAVVRPGVEPQFNIVHAEGRDAVLLNIRSQPDASTVGIADVLQRELEVLRSELPPDMKLAFFYDQSLFVRQAVGSVWEAIFFGLALSVLVLYLFLRNWGTTFVATLVIPVTVLVTLLFMRVTGMSFNLMTLGGIAAAIGLVIDDAIVVVESIYAKLVAGHAAVEAIRESAAEITLPLVGSTLTPVVVFIPLAFLAGVSGVFFRALAMTMVVSLLTSLVLAVTLTPTLAARLMRPPKPRPHYPARVVSHPSLWSRLRSAAVRVLGDSRHAEGAESELEQGGPVLRAIIRLYESAVRWALRHWALTTTVSLAILAATVGLYLTLDSDFLPKMDEGAFVVDYFSAPGTSLSETNRMLEHVERILGECHEVESYSRRTGARLALAIAEPNTGDFLVKLRADRKKNTEEVIEGLRHEIQAAEPALHTEFPGVLSDLIGDLTWSPSPIEVKVFSTDTAVLTAKATEIADAISKIDGVVDVNNGLVVAGPTLTLRVRPSDAARLGMRADEVAAMMNSAFLGQVASPVLKGDRLVNIRVLMDPQAHDRVEKVKQLLVRPQHGPAVRIDQVADVRFEPGQLEMRREDLRQDVAVKARLEKRDLGGAMRDIQAKLADSVDRTGVTIEYGGMFQQQQEAFFNLLLVLATAILLVFTVLLIEFRSIRPPLAIVFGAVLSLFGVVAGLWITGMSLNVVSMLGSIIGVGIVAKNGILMLDFVDHLRAQGVPLSEALVLSGRRRLRPVLMTSLTAALGMLPLAYGVGTGAQMLQPLAIAVMGALLMSVLLALVATPTMYYVLMRSLRLAPGAEEPAAAHPERAVPVA